MKLIDELKNDYDSIESQSAKMFGDKLTRCEIILLNLMTIISHILTYIIRKDSSNANIH